MSERTWPAPKKKFLRGRRPRSPSFFSFFFVFCFFPYRAALFFNPISHPTVHSTYPAPTTPRPPQRVPGGTLIVRCWWPRYVCSLTGLKGLGAPNSPGVTIDDTAGNGPPPAAPSAPVRPCTRGVKRPMGEWKYSVYG